MTTWPITGRPITTRYGIRGSHWKACGFHTGADIAAPTGTPILAPEAGRIVHVNYGASFGGKQLVLRPASGGEWFFAHCSWRIGPSGVQVAEGTHIANVGTEGNSTGPHLHLEWHVAPGWSCALMRDPAARLTNPTPTPTPPAPEPEDDDMTKWLVNMGAEYGWWLTDFATFRTGVSDPAVGHEGIQFGAFKWFANGAEVGGGWRAHVMKLPRIDG